MALKLFENSIDGGILTDPDTFYREQQQAFQDAQWENTSALTTIFEQDGFGLDTYHEEEVWANKVIGVTSTFMKNGQDFMQILFKSVTRHCERGLMYKYDGSYWLADFYNPEQGLSKDVSIRRCNNHLRMIDPENGSVFSIPCVVDYDMTSPSVQVSSYVITPNNHALVYVQANEDTLRLFKYNTRFMLRGRPFKLLSFQDTLNKSADEGYPPILYLDLYLDELHADDDIENSIADNGIYEYSIVSTVKTLKLVQGSGGTLSAKVMLNGREVKRDIVWTSNRKFIEIYGNTYRLNELAKIGSKAKIIGMLKGNSDIKVSVSVVVVEQDEHTVDIVLSPMFDKIRQHDSFTVSIVTTLDGVERYADKYIITSDGGLSIVDANLNEFTVKCEKLDKNSHIYVTAENVGDSGLKAEKTFNIACVNMFG